MKRASLSQTCSDRGPLQPINVASINTSKTRYNGARGFSDAPASTFGRSTGKARSFARGEPPWRCRLKNFRSLRVGESATIDLCNGELLEGWRGSFFVAVSGVISSIGLLEPGRDPGVIRDCWEKHRGGELRTAFSATLWYY